MESTKGPEIELSSMPRQILFDYIGLAKKFVWVFPEDVVKNPNELFGQPNSFLDEVSS